MSYSGSVLKSLLLFIAGVGLIVFGIIKFADPAFNAFFPIPFGFIVIGIGGISVGLSGLGAKGAAIPFAIIMMLGAVYLIGKIVLLLVV